MKTENRYLTAALVCYALAFIFAALIVMGGCSLKTSQIAHVSIQGLDLASTSYAESRGAVEANPVMQTNVPTRIALKAAATAGLIWMTSRIHNEGHQKLAKALIVALNGMLGAVVINNVRIAQ